MGSTLAPTGVGVRAALPFRLMSDHYQALGITPDASQAEVRAAYLRVMRDSHPDRRPGDAVAADAARAANAAWEVLGSSARRASYDRLRSRRPDGTPVVAVRVVHSRADEERLRVYRAEGERYRRSFGTSILRLGVAVFAVGLLLLAFTAA
jgi:curved DNA-binding protein CbpA